VPDRAEPRRSVSVLFAESDGELAGRIGLPAPALALAAVAPKHRQALVAGVAHAAVLVESDLAHPGDEPRSKGVRVEVVGVAASLAPARLSAIPLA